MIVTRVYSKHPTSLAVGVFCSPGSIQAKIVFGNPEAMHRHESGQMIMGISAVG